EEAQAATFHPLVFQRERKSESQRRLASDDAVAAPKIFVRREKMHRAALAFGTTGGSAEQFRHALVHGHAHRQRVAVTAITRNDMIILATKRERADGD